MRNLNGGKSRSRDSTMDPLKKPVFIEEGCRVFPGKNPDTMVFHRVHKSIEEVCPVFEPAVKHFILADSEGQEHTGIVVFAIFTTRFEFFGACHGPL